MSDRFSLYSQEKLESYLELCQQAFNQILLLFDSEPPTSVSPKIFNHLLNEIRSELGDWKSVAEKLNITEDEIKQLNQTLRNYIKYEKIDPQSNNVIIAILRLIEQLERIKLKQPLLTYSTHLYKENKSSQFQCIKKVRALELMIRDLINHSYQEQSLLLNRLDELFGRETVKKWLNISDQGDILTGTNFSDLAALFVNKEEYKKHYGIIYEENSLLGFMIEKRKTLRLFLDDVRYIRNRAAHHKVLTTAQMELLNCYYFEISLPVQYAYDNETTKVNPDYYLDASESDINAYLTSVQNKLDKLGEDTADIKMIVERQESKVDDIKKDTGLLRKKMLWIIIGIVLLNVISILIAYRTTTTLMNTEMILSDVGHLDQLMSEAKQEIIYDPRKELTKIGVTWSEDNLRDAIISGDIRVANLFLDGGMPWKLLYAVDTFRFSYNGTLKSLIRHASLHNEHGQSPESDIDSTEHGCAVLFVTAKTLIAENRPLNPTQIDFLRTFCGSSDALLKAKDKFNLLIEQAKELDRGKPSTKTLLSRCKKQRMDEIKTTISSGKISEEIIDLIEDYCENEVKRVIEKMKKDNQHEESKAWKILFDEIAND